VFDKFSLQTRRRINLKCLEELITDYRQDFFRIKGFILDEQYRLLHVDYSVSSGLEIQPAKKNSNTHLEFIFNGLKSELLKRRIRAFIKAGFLP
jgi:hypothetical protein